MPRRSRRQPSVAKSLVGDALIENIMISLSAPQPAWRNGRAMSLPDIDLPRR